MDGNGCSIGTHILSYKPTYSEDSNEDGGLHFQRFCFDIEGVRDVAQLYIDALYELDRYVSRLRKKYFE